MSQDEPETHHRTIGVTRPLLPAADDLIPYIRDIIGRRWVSNNGKYLREFESALRRYLHGDHLAVVTNGTLALDLAIRCLDIEGEVITTGFTFPATYHVLHNIPGITPVFADINDDYSLDPMSVRRWITDDTRAIVAVHPYGYPCDVERLQMIADEHGLYLVYDAAASFGVMVNGRDISKFGDVSTFSFSAAKVFSTLEGGCITSPSKPVIEKAKLMSNFGIKSPDEVVSTGSNAKMDEVRAVFGLLTLKLVDKAIQRRRKIVSQYLAALDEFAGDDIVVRRNLYSNPDLRLNYTYFPVLIHPTPDFSRDVVHAAMRRAGIEARKYYYPSVADIPVYADMRGMDDLEKTRYVSRNVVCLPVHHEMTGEDCERVIDVFADLYHRTR